MEVATGAPFAMRRQQVEAAAPQSAYAPPMLRPLLLLGSLSFTACTASQPAIDADGPGSSVPEEVANPAETPPFDVTVRDWEGSAGDDAQIVVIVTARDGFKINAGYPHKVVLDPPPEGLTLPMSTVRKEDAELDGTKSITYAIPAKPSQSGTFEVTGLVKLSVCNPEQCRMAKKRLMARVTAR
jgi:hypothetical protein